MYYIFYRIIADRGLLGRNNLMLQKQNQEELRKIMREIHNLKIQVVDVRNKKKYLNVWGKRRVTIAILT